MLSIKSTLFFITTLVCLLFNFQTVHADVVISFTQEIKPMEAKEYARKKKIVDAKKERIQERIKKLKEIAVDRKTGKVYDSSDVKEISRNVLNNLDTTDDLLLDTYSNQFEDIGSNTTDLNSPIVYIYSNNKDPG